MAQALAYFNSPLSQIKNVHKTSLHFSQLNNNHQLPEEYTTVPAVVLNKESIVVTKMSDHVSSIHGHLEEAKVKEKPWLEHGMRLLLKDELEKDVQ